MAEAAVSSLLESLKGRQRMIMGDEKEVEQVERDVEILRAFLRDLGDDESRGYIKKDIWNVVFKLEDIVDIYTNKKVSASIKSRIGRFLRRGSPLGASVNSLIEQEVRPIIDKFPTCRPSTSQQERRTVKKDKDNLLRRYKVVGLEDDETTLIERILEEKEELDIISITGVHGLGKTTLASKIYENQRIAYEFPIRFWIHISPKFNKKDMLTQIVKMFTRLDVSGMSDDELSRDVRGCLRYKKFFLVLDDVCSDEDWECIQNILTRSNGKGKVLITTSIMNFGAQDGVYSHHLHLLTFEESWELLQLEVFGDVAGCPVELESIGRDIAKKCDGLPLSVVTAGPLLRMSMNTENLAEIHHFLSNEIVSLLSVAKLAYRRLPDELKHCFLYMGVFPEDYEIPSWTLIRLWIAEGFIQPMERMSLEETATQYLDYLISWRLVMASKINLIGEVTTCRVHDMIRGFCVEEAQEEAVFRLIKVSGDGVVDRSQQENCRRLSVHSNSNRVLQLPRFESGRSFLHFNEGSTVVDPGDISAMLDAFQHLKVWESKSLQFDHFPSRIYKLFLLKYITLSVHHLNSLPETLSRLWNLQTLVVHTTSRFIRVRTNIWRLMQLRHLKTNAIIVLNLKGKGVAGENLQTLDRLAPESCTADMCERACNLKTLGIQGVLGTLFKDVSLSKLNGLEKLKLLDDYEPGPRNDVCLPQHSFFPPYLRRLTLSNTCLPWECMSTLAKLVCLEVLKLKQCAFTGIYWSVSASFINLRSLLISNTDLILWEAPTCSFPLLRHLVLKNCENLLDIPCNLTESLDILDISGVSQSMVDSAIEVAEIKKKEGKPGFPFRLIIRPIVVVPCK